MSERTAPAPDLAVALETVGAVQAAIRRADTKAAALAGLQLSVLTIALGNADVARHLWEADGVGRWSAGILTAGLVAGLAASFSFLGAVLWPRTATSAADGRFAFPALAARQDLPDNEPPRLREDAWSLAIALSRTADRKYRMIHFAMGAMSASTASIVAWLCLAITTA